MAKVYVYNVGSQAMGLNINNGPPAEALPPVSKSSDKPYTPTPISIEMSDTTSGSNAVFIWGQVNTVATQTQTGISSPVELKFPPSPKQPETDNFFLYVFPTKMVLMQPTGEIVDEKNYTVP